MNARLRIARAATLLALTLYATFDACAMNIGEDGGHGFLASIVTFLLLLFAFVIVPLAVIGGPIALIAWLVRALRRRASRRREAG
jgi:uncharacterized membrane protein YozB (DUF420 family)